MAEWRYSSTILALGIRNEELKVSIEKETGWASKLVWTLCKKEKPFDPAWKRSHKKCSSAHCYRSLSGCTMAACN
jgi:hypothetical protein